MMPVPAKLWSALLVAMCLAMPALAGAVTVYRWIDADGVTHFSQTPPPPDARSVQTMDLKIPQAPPEDAAAESARLELQAERARRRELEKRLQAEEEARRRAEAERAPDVIYVNPPEDQGYLLLAPPRRHRPHHRHIPQPVPPGARTQTPDLYRVPDDFYESLHPHRREPRPRQRTEHPAPRHRNVDKTR